MGKAMFVVLLGFLGATLSSALHNETDNLAESSVTSYSTVVIHHPQPKNKKGLVKEGDEGRSQSYFKVKRVRASTVPPQRDVQGNGVNTRSAAESGGDLRENGKDYKTKGEHRDFKPHIPEPSPNQNGKNQKYSSDSDKSDFKPSQYLPDSSSRTSFKESKDQFGQGTRHSELVGGKEHSEPNVRRHKYKDDSEEENESTKWRQQYRHKPRHQSSEESAVISRVKQDNGQFHREVFINHDYRPQNEKVKYHSAKLENFPSSQFVYDSLNAIPAVPSEVLNPFQSLSLSPDKKLRPIPPPGMSEELIETLLSQQPQTFDSEPKSAVISESPKKGKGQTFKVGYSIGFGNGGGDVVVGKPKDVRLHVNGRNSVWKTLPQGVEMSAELEDKKPMALKLQDNSFRGSENVLKNDVYYMQNFKPDTSVPTSGRSSFNHAQALTSSNTFDFSNAMEEPKWTKQPRALQPQVDLGGIYQSMGYPPPLPVFLPGGAKGEGTMVQAIVIPIEQIAGFDYNWATVPHVPMVPVGAQPVAQALTLTPLVAASPLVPSELPSNHQMAYHNHRPAHQNQEVDLHNHRPSHQNQELDLHNHRPSHQNQELDLPNHKPDFHNHKPAVQSHQVMSTQTHEKKRYKVRAPKLRDLPTHKQQFASYSSSPIIVAPAPHKRQSELQQELNNILAEEMMRKNHRMVYNLRHNNM